MRLAICVVAFLGALLFSVSVGHYRVPFPDALLYALGFGKGTAALVVREIRLPRFLMGFLVGAVLSVSGASLQAVLRNPLVDPHIIGISVGAGFGAALAIIVFESIPLAMPFAFAGAVISFLLVINLARVGKSLPAEFVILAGIAVGSFFRAVEQVLAFVVADVFRRETALFWFVGGFSLADWRTLRVCLVPFLVCVVGTLLLGRELDILSVGEEQALFLGVNVDFVKWAVICLVALGVSFQVVYSGFIGFVGLVVPHMVRLVVGPRNTLLVPLSAIYGGIFLSLLDTIGRVILPGAEIPVGIITAIIGAPFFAYLLLRRKKAVVGQ